MYTGTASKNMHNRNLKRRPSQPAHLLVVVAKRTTHDVHNLSDSDILDQPLHLQNAGKVDVLGLDGAKEVVRSAKLLNGTVDVEETEEQVLLLPFPVETAIPLASLSNVY